MSLISQIKADQLSARKARNKAKSTLLTTLLGEAGMIGKNDGDRDSTDSEVTAVVKKFIKNIDESLKVCHNDVLVAERQILSDYMPNQLSDEGLKAAIEAIIKSQELTGPRSMGVVMKELNFGFPDQFDGKMAAELAKTLLL